jgi:hypothetical protein
MYGSRSGNDPVGRSFPIARVYRKTEAAEPFARALSLLVGGAASSVVAIHGLEVRQRTYAQEILRILRAKGHRPATKLKALFRTCWYARSPSYRQYISALDPYTADAREIAHLISSAPAPLRRTSSSDPIMAIAVSSPSGDWSLQADPTVPPSGRLVWMADHEPHQRLLAYWPEADHAAIEPAVESIVIHRYDL